MLHHLQAVHWMKKYLNYVDYIGAAQLYLKDNFLLKEPLKAEHIKPRILGHWGTVPGINLIYAGLNHLIHRHKNECEMLLITGPGHGAPGVLANLYAEGTLKQFYSKYSLDGKGMGNLIHDFSWPHTLFPSHVTPTVPGSILEGGELGYSLSTAFGAAFDNPDLIVATIVGDGEAETGPLAAAWHSNKFLNPKTSGAVLPIVHSNGYKISNPTLFGTMNDGEIEMLFKGYGYEPIIVEGSNLEGKWIKALEKAYQKIRTIQKKARAKKSRVPKPQWPMLFLRSPKGWKGLHRFHDKAIEGSFHSHGIPLSHPKENPDELKAIEQWLCSYRIEKWIDEKGSPKSSVLKYVPHGQERMGMNIHARGGELLKPLKIPDLKKYETQLKKPTTSNQASQKKSPSPHSVSCQLSTVNYSTASSMIQAGQFLRDLIKNNKTNFRLLCPDELESNRLSEVFKTTKRAYLWPIHANDENQSPDGRVMEILSEHTLQGWLQGYLLTGRYGIFVSYEAFITIVSSMVDQYAKFLKQSQKVKWRKPIASAIYLLSSVGWRQDHNGYSHQNPSFVSNVLQKHSKFCQIYYPPDANSLLVALEETLKKKNSICVIVAGKNELPQWLSLDQAREQAKEGMAIWNWVGGKEANENPDVVLASAGDHITQEAILAVQFCKEIVPELKIRYVNVSELTSLSLGDYYKPDSKAKTVDMEKRLHHFFTKDKPVVFSYHGYVNDLEQILWPYTTSSRFSLHGYREEGSTTTPFDLKILNGVSYYHLAMDLIEQAAKQNKSLSKKTPQIRKEIKKKIAAHQKYIIQQGDDPPEIENLKMTNHQ